MTLCGWKDGKEERLLAVRNTLSSVRPPSIAKWRAALSLALRLEVIIYAAAERMKMLIVITKTSLVQVNESVTPDRGLAARIP